MATTYKVLGQSSPAAATDTALYTVPAATSAVCSTIVVCNQAANAATFRIAVRPAGAVLAVQHYLSYDTNINANDSITITTNCESDEFANLVRKNYKNLGDVSSPGVGSVAIVKIKG